MAQWHHSNLKMRLGPRGGLEPDAGREVQPDGIGAISGPERAATTHVFSGPFCLFIPPAGTERIPRRGFNFMRIFNIVVTTTNQGTGAPFRMFFNIWRMSSGMSRMKR